MAGAVSTVSFCVSVMAGALSHSFLLFPLWPERCPIVSHCFLYGRSADTTFSFCFLYGRSADRQFSFVFFMAGAQSQSPFVSVTAGALSDSFPLFSIWPKSCPTVSLCFLYGRIAVPQFPFVSFMAGSLSHSFLCFIYGRIAVPQFPLVSFMAGSLSRHFPERCHFPLWPPRWVMFETCPPAMTGTSAREPFSSCFPILTAATLP